MSNVVALDIYKEEYQPLILSPYNDHDTIIGFCKTEHADQLIEDLLADLISAKNRGNKEDQVAFLVQSYMQIFNGGRLPDVSELCEYAVEHNAEILWRVAEIDMANDYTENFTQMAEDEGGFSCVDWSETLQCNYESWSDSIYDEYTNDLYSWVRDILDEYKFVYVEDGGSRANLCLRFNPSLHIMYNECQNVLNPEWFTKGMSYLGDLIDLNVAQVVSIW